MKRVMNNMELHAASAAKAKLQDQEQPSKEEGPQPSIGIRAQDLIVSKRKLKHVDRKDVFETATLDKTGLFNNGEGITENMVEFLPLHIARHNIITTNLTNDLVTLNFSGVEMLTDAVFFILSYTNTTFRSLKKLICSGCCHLTDLGVTWIARMAPELRMAELEGCSKVTEKGLHALCKNCPHLQNLSIVATNVCRIPHEIGKTEVSHGSLRAHGAPIISSDLYLHEKANNTSTKSDSEEKKPSGRCQNIPVFKMVVLRDESMTKTFKDMVIKTEDNCAALPAILVWESWQPKTLNVEDLDVKVNITEIAAQSPLQDTVISPGSIVMIVYTVPSNEESEKVGHRLAETIGSVVAKFPDVVMVTLGLKASENLSSGVHEAIIKTLTNWSKAINNDIEFIVRKSWHMENIDFNGQLSISAMGQAHEKLKELIATDSNFLIMLSCMPGHLSVALATCLTAAIQSVKANFPWIHDPVDNSCFQLMDLLPIKPLTSLHQEYHCMNKNVRKQFHHRQAYPCMRKIVDLMAQCGHALYLPGSRDDLYVTDLQGYSSLICAFSETRPPVSGNFSCLGGLTSFWNKAAVAEFLKNHSAEIKVDDFIKLTTKQALVFPLRSTPSQKPPIEEGSINTKSSDSNFSEMVFIHIKDLPITHPALDQLWPDTIPPNTLHASLFHTIFPGLPPSVLLHVFRHIVKVINPMLVWRTGLLLRQGPVDVLVQLWYTNLEHQESALSQESSTSSLQGSPVLVISGRLPMLPSQEPAARLNNNKCLWGALQTVSVITDYVFRKHNIATHVTVPCDQCCEGNLKLALKRESVFHFVYYATFSADERGSMCKIHKVKPSIEEKCGPQYPSIVPFHNYVYLQAANQRFNQLKTDGHFRHPDTIQICFLCCDGMSLLCHHCHICSRCIRYLAKCESFIKPGFVRVNSVIKHGVQSEPMADPEAEASHIQTTVTGPLLNMKKNQSVTLNQPLTPVYFNKASIRILRGYHFSVRGDLPNGQFFEFQGPTGTFLDTQGNSKTQADIKCCLGNVLSICMQFSEMPGKSDVSLYLNGLEISKETVDGWEIQLTISKTITGLTALCIPGVKNSWQLAKRSQFFPGNTVEILQKESSVILPGLVTAAEHKRTQFIVSPTGENISFNSKRIRPRGYAELKQKEMSGNFADLEAPPNTLKEPLPLWKFQEQHFLDCLEELLMKVNDLDELIAPCTDIISPAVLFAEMESKKDLVEKALFQDGHVDFNGTAMVLLPSYLSVKDLAFIPLNRLTHELCAHPLCYIRGDINSVMSVQPTYNLPSQVECFRIVHLLNNPGFPFPMESETSFRPLIWAWALMLLHLQKEGLKNYDHLLENFSDMEISSLDEIWKGLRQMVSVLAFLLYLSFKDQLSPYYFQEYETVKEHAANLKSKLRMQMGDVASQELEIRTMAFTSDELLMCTGHSSTWQAGQGLTEVSKPFLTHYPQFIYSLMLSNNQLKAIPGSVFTSLYNIKDLDLSDNLLEVLPEEIGQCQFLQSLALDKNFLTALPDSLENCKNMRRLDISRNHFKKFPKVVTKLTSLLRLYAQSLQLTFLPDDIGNLSNLQNLYVNGNCFSLLPSSITKLQKLKDLSLNGVPWCKVRANQLLSKEHFENMMTEQNLSRWLDANNQSKAAIFQLFDEDANGTLDPKEIGKLNATIFTIFPRFGYVSSEPPSDETPSGFPEEILSLEALEYLSLQYQGIVGVPNGIQRLSKLSVLNVSHNPNLLSVSAHAGNLPLKRLEMDECPLLKTPPKEIRAKGFFSCHAYLKRLLSGSVDCKRTKLMLVGLGGAGKTSLVKALMSDTDKADMNIGEEITDGIDIHPWIVDTEEGPLKFSVWDFAGQTVYYNTHQFFLSDRAVYLLMWNIRLGHEHAGLDFWLSSISVHAPKAPIFVVGTHVDQVSKVELPTKEMQKKYNQIVGFFFVSSFTGQGIKNLKEKVVEITLQQQYMGEKIPGVWLSFEDNMKRIADRSVIPYSELEKIANQSGIFEKSEVVQAVQFLHELGSLQHFTKEFLKDQVVINPQWIVDVMACVVSVKDSPIKDGRLKHEDISTVWKDYPVHLHSWLLRLTEEYDLTFPLGDEKVNLVPCLLTEKEPEFEWPEIEKGSEARETKMVYKFHYLPAGLFNRGQVRLHEFSDGSLIWKRGSYLHKNGHLCLVRQSRDSELLVQAQGPRPDNILFLVHEVYEGLILESFQGVTYDYLIPCPECLRLMLKDPHMFPASIVRRAVELKAPFLQCLKYFHTISIVDLQASMPPDSSTDFDMHLVQAVRGLKELHHDLAADIFVSFCNEDEVGDKPGIISPSRVINEMMKIGYKSWVADKNSSMDEMVKALMDAKLFVVFMTNAYVNDEVCCNLFKYARLTLHKPLLLITVGTGFEWQQGRLGILLADEVYVNMQQADRYEIKLKELKERLKDRITQKVAREEKEFPPCFISYCWQNSTRAVARGSRAIEGAIGYGDPRDIKDFLESKGIACWIDVERVGLHGLFEDIGEGLAKAKVVVACISDQYATSNNCMVEFRYAANALKLPIILAIVGTGSRWRATEVGTLSQNYPMVSFQEQQSQAAFERLANMIQQYLVTPCIEREKVKVAKDGHDHKSLSFQELCELVQRKFLRQLAVYAEIQDSIIYPRLFLIDFVKTFMDPAQVPSGEVKNGGEGNQTQTQDASKVDFREKSYCAHILCEQEEGWHVSGDPLPLPPQFGTTLEKYAPFMARITAIAKYSKKMVMNCMGTEVGKQFLQWLEKNPQITENSDFQDSYHALRQTIAEADQSSVMGNTARCHLPNGRVVWLCEKHRKNARVTVLSEADTITSSLHTTESVSVDYMIQALREMNTTDMSKHEPHNEFSTGKHSKLLHTKHEIPTSGASPSSLTLSSTARDTSSTESKSLQPFTSSQTLQVQETVGLTGSLHRQPSQLTFSGVKSRTCVLM
ncbi:uncharacterized protein LOC112554025 isoform X3 [Pomacea canaliculata]|uniref:uncharacterized protein LOC112554025 isoform X3 n=1 Tax=Pomacea canaliculata TaxID=400727 RepID=UPI000D735F38|nr:uncharacterized protein LOC112554025 isoform X3 [Pomacea canaliculata]